MSKHIRLLITVFCLLTTGLAFSQGLGPMPGNGSVAGGLGLTAIDDETYFTINFRPELALGKFGIGLNIDLLYNTQTGHIRTKDWNEDYDYLRLIRYVRYGHKKDKFYTQVGALDAARLGHGFIMNFYTNQASYDQRKIGLALDWDLDYGGFETVTSNLGRLEVIGGRGYVRPLKPFIPIPIIKNLAFGYTYVVDTDPDAYRGTNDDVQAWGLDAELPLVNIPMFYSGLYYDYAKITDFGSGQAYGIEASLKGVAGLFQITAKLERRLLGEKFLPSYFGAFYEVEKYNISKTDTVRKTDYLSKIAEDTKGVYGELVGHVLNTIQIVGSFQRLDDTPHSGILHVVAEVPDAVPKIAARATYDKAGIEKVKDLSVDDSIARVGLGYKLKPWLLVYMDYIYSFDKDEETGKIKTQRRIQPSVSIVYNFPLGQ
ncbi:MAG: hypothetical protein ONB05_01240 [candidate division KSB1 bacterium]|nr:hypothetical protein [candidate division KSB1 bacterium]